MRMSRARARSTTTLGRPGPRRPCGTRLAGELLAGQTGFGALREADTLLFGDGSKDGDDRVFEDAAGIQILFRIRAVADAPLCEAIEQMQGGQNPFARETVKRPEEQTIEAALFSVSDHELVAVPITGFTAGIIAVNLEDRPTLLRGKGLQLEKLIFGILAAVSGGDAGIDSAIHNRYIVPYY